MMHTCGYAEAPCCAHNASFTTEAPAPQSSVTVSYFAYIWVLLGSVQRTQGSFRAEAPQLYYEAPCSAHKAPFGSDT
eukprot:365216-Chlamydomonas_euryale.AAC.1